METVGNVLDSLPPAGHNAGTQQEMLRDELEAENDALLRRTGDLLSAVDRAPPINDDDVAGKVSDMVKMLGAAIKVSETTRMSRKEPYEALADVIHTFYKKRITDPLKDGKARMEAKLGVYLRETAAREKAIRDQAERVAREAQRLAQEAARKAAEAMQNEKDLQAALDAQARADEAAIASVAASKAAAAKPAEMSRTRGDIGSLGTLRQHWTGEVVDRETLDLGPLRQHLSLDDLNKAVRAYVKAGGRFLDGAKIYEAQEVIVR